MEITVTQLITQLFSWTEQLVDYRGLKSKAWGFLSRLSHG